MVALVVTIVVLLILAAVSISLVLGQNGIITKTSDAATKFNDAAVDEQKELENVNKWMENFINTDGSTETPITVTEAQVEDTMKTKKNNTTVEDDYKNKIVIPAGFYITTDATEVTEGIVISDGESEYVWVPVGNIKKSDGSSVDIILGRYTFDTDGKETLIQSGVNYLQTGKSTAIKVPGLSSYVWEELKTSTYTDTTVAKDIEEFIRSANINGGYYIGRYEARTETERTYENGLTLATENGNQYVYNYITKVQASNLAQAAYTSSDFTSDLINSYAWDTALIFIQAFSGDSDYSRQSSFNQFEYNNYPYQGLAPKGTNNLETVDKVCNICDMASNLWEWTTEICDNVYFYSFRGDVFDFYSGSAGYAGCRDISYQQNYDQKNNYNCRI